MRALLPLLLPLAACSGKSSDTSTEPGSCAPSGTLSGCLLYESTDCVGNTALDGLPGGWFDDSRGQLTLGLAESNQGIEILLHVPDAAGLNDGSEYAIPLQAAVELWDRSGSEDVLYYACNGTLRVTNYTPGEVLWANMTFMARGPMGLCGEADFWSVGAELVDASFCAR